MCLVGLQSSDGKTDHAVAVTENWIFDSNLNHALPLTKESLDLCCSDGENESTFVKITRGCMLKKQSLPARQNKKSDSNKRGQRCGESDEEHGDTEEDRPNYSLGLAICEMAVKKPRQTRGQDPFLFAEMCYKFVEDSKRERREQERLERQKKGGRKKDDSKKDPPESDDTK
jgi:hypothetical protein